MGGIMDGIAQVLTSACTCEDGHFLEGSWDNYFYTRQWNVPPDVQVHRHAADRGPSPAAPASSACAAAMAAVACAYARATGTMPTSFPINHATPLGLRPAAHRAADPAVAHRRPRRTPTEEHSNARRTRFILNGEPVTVDVADDVRLLWVLRDLLGVTGPKYGCGIDVCKACTMPHQRQGVQPVRGAGLRHRRPTDEITTIEGLPATVGEDLHPMQEAWLDVDVAQCGYCQPGQIMAAVALVKQAKAEGREITDADLDAIRNICRCGTYPRIREAIEAAAAQM